MKISTNNTKSNHAAHESIKGNELFSHKDKSSDTSLEQLLIKIITKYNKLLTKYNKEKRKT